MAKTMSLLLMLVMLGVFMQSSEAKIKCYMCVNCDLPTGATCEAGNVCLKKVISQGAFTIYSVLMIIYVHSA